MIIEGCHWRAAEGFRPSAGPPSYASAASYRKKRLRFIASAFSAESLAPLADGSFRRQMAPSSFFRRRDALAHQLLLSRARGRCHISTLFLVPSTQQISTSRARDQTATPARAGMTLPVADALSLMVTPRFSPPPVITPMRTVASPASILHGAAARLPVATPCREQGWPR